MPRNKPLLPQFLGFFLGFTAFALLAGCHKSPIERAHNASGGATGSFGTSGTFPIFSSELKTGGGAFEYPGGDNQSLSFADRSNALSDRSIRYAWNGQPTDGGNVHAFAGFTLMNVVSQAQYADPSNTGRNLASAGYHRATFYARGSLSTNTALKVEVGNGLSACITLSADGTQDACNLLTEIDLGKATFTGSWQKFTIPITMSSTLTNIKDFFKATFAYTDPLPGVPNQAPGQGGTVYFDQIQYEP